MPLSCMGDNMIEAKIVSWRNLKVTMVVPASTLSYLCFRGNWDIQPLLGLSDKHIAEL
jgi:hypothetical protein